MLTATRRPTPEGHTLQLYGNDQERFDIAAAWTGAGIARGEKVVHTVSSYQDQQQLLAALVDRFDAERPLATGQLTVWSLRDLYPLDPGRLRQLGEGYTGLRVSGPTNIAVNRLTGAEYAVYEAGVNALCRDFAIGALCQYDTRLSPPAGLWKALTPHDRVQDSSVTLDTRADLLNNQVRVTVSGDLDSANTHLLRLVLQRAVRQGHTRDTLVLQLGELGSLSATALRAIIEGTKTWRARGGVVRLMNPSPFTYRLIRLTKLDRLPGIQVAVGAP